MINRKSQFLYTESVLANFKQVGNNLIGGEYKIGNSTKFLIENCVKWLFGQPFKTNIAGSNKYKDGNLNKGIFVAGQCGTGKSLFFKLFKEFAKNFEQIFEINGKSTKPNWITYNAQELCNKYRNGENLEFLYNAPLIQIDDLGAEPLNSQYMGNKIELMREILEIREDKNVVTFITSNLCPSSEEFEDRYGERLFSRMKALNYFSLKGNDKREL